MSCMHGWLGQVSLSNQLESVDLIESTIINDGYMWIIYSWLQGKLLYIEAINKISHGSLSSSNQEHVDHVDQYEKYGLWCFCHIMLWLSVVMVSLDTTSCVFEI